jgi:hypothetical protein
MHGCGADRRALRRLPVGAAALVHEPRQVSVGLYPGEVMLRRRLDHSARSLGVGKPRALSNTLAVVGKLVGDAAFAKLFTRPNTTSPIRVELASKSM